jgi:hypothetical protein
MKYQILSFALLVVCTGLLQAADGTLKPSTVQRSSATDHAVFDSDPKHLWNRLHRALFVRNSGGDDSYGAGQVDPPLWADTQAFLLAGESHRSAISVLDEFLANAGEELHTDPLKRVILQHDLWSVFDWTANATTAFDHPASDALPKVDDHESARRALRERLSAAIRRLALEQAQIDALPNNYAQAIRSKTYASGFSTDDPAQAFLPSDLFDAKSTWVCVRGAASGPTAPIHTNYYRGRAAFLVYLHLPDGVQSTEAYLTKLNEAMEASTAETAGSLALPQFPVGTAVALVRQMSAISTQGQITPTPIIQTVQLRAYRQVGGDIKDHAASQAMVKFKLDRAALFAEAAGGLVPVTTKQRLVQSILNDTESNYVGENQQTVLSSCIACHSCGGSTARGIFTFDQHSWVGYKKLAEQDQRLIPTNLETELARTAAWKQTRHDWQLLQGWMSIDRVRNPGKTEVLGASNLPN